MIKHAAILLALVVGCGDNLHEPSDTCEPVPPPAPLQGPFADPLAILRATS